MTGTPVQYRAIVLDNDGHTRMSRVRSTETAPPRLTLSSPAEGALVRDQLRLLANTDPERSDQSVTFFRRIGTRPLNDIVHLPGRGDVPTGREPGGDRSFFPIKSPEV